MRTCGDIGVSAYFQELDPEAEVVNSSSDDDDDNGTDDDEDNGTDDDEDGSGRFLLPTHLILGLFTQCTVGLLIPLGFISDLSRLAPGLTDGRRWVSHTCSCELGGDGLGHCSWPWRGHGVLG